jgi:DNA-binding NtrC family response regulator
METDPRVIHRLENALALAKLVGEAPAFRKAIAHLPAAAMSDATVLISGETGTGKELVARAIHYLSDRAPFPFVAVNCGAVTDTLMEDELFGHERGAFTDARYHRPGLIEQAQQGTLFLDEIEALTGHGQVVLLRVLQDQTFRPLGSRGERQANVRFIAATNAELSPRTAQASFRADLYYRLCVFRIELPPLRDRRQDILPLAAHLLRKHAPAEGRPRDFSAAARRALLAFDWPGNVRELENAVIRALWTCRTTVIEAEDLALPGIGASGSPCSPPPVGPSTYAALKRLAIEAFEREFLDRTMREHRGNVTRAARAAGKDRRELGKLLKKHQLDPKLFARTPDDPPGGISPDLG